MEATLIFHDDPQYDKEVFIEDFDFDTYEYPLDVYSLKIIYEDFNFLPHSIERFANLVCLIINYNKELEFISDNLGKLTQLRHLDFESCKLSRLPDSIKNLTEVEFLHLAGNRFEEIPESIFNLTKLERLFLKGNNINFIPEGINKLYRLKDLDLDDDD